MYFRTYLSLVFIGLTTIFNHGLSTRVNGGESIFCARAEITEVRIGNCAAEPCQIKKGVTVPVEVDFSFQAPPSTDTIYFDVFMAYWNKPGTGSYGHYIGHASACSELNLGGPCPAVAGTNYTLHSSIFIDTESNDSLTGATTGQRKTSWTLTPILRKNDEASSYSTCAWMVDLNIIE